MPKKTKKFFFFIIKLAIVVAALYFIYDKIVHNQQLSFQNFIIQLETRVFTSYTTIILLIGLSLGNWFFEIAKWKTLVSTIKLLTFYDAFQQSLGSLTASLFTPNRIGEYGAKAIYFKKGNRKKVMLLNLIGNSSQMAITIFLGSIGLIYIFIHFDVKIDSYRFKKVGYILTFLFLILVGASLKGFKKISHFYIDKSIRFVRNMQSNLHLKIIRYSLLRYAFFSHQFYFLLIVFGVDLNYITAMSLITSMYVLASIIPSLALFDWLIKGSVAIWVFSLVGINELVIVTITLLMWILNFGVPAVIGSYFVLNFNTVQQK